jgi:ribonucleoside-diphosphate reductase alpha chain
MQVGEGALFREDLTAIEHLRLWLLYQRHWCEHKPSVTISVLEEEWPEVGAWVWKNFDEITGVSFLPMDGGTYRQAPYETITAEDYNKLFAEMPKGIDWEAFVEKTDNVEGAQMLACTAGNCEVSF